MVRCVYLWKCSCTHVSDMFCQCNNMALPKGLCSGLYDGEYASADAWSGKGELLGHMHFTCHDKPLIGTVCEAFTGKRRHFQDT